MIQWLLELVMGILGYKKRVTSDDMAKKTKDSFKDLDTNAKLRVLSNLRKR